MVGLGWWAGRRKEPVTEPHVCEGVWPAENRPRVGYDWNWREHGLSGGDPLDTHGHMWWGPRRGRAGDGNEIKKKPPVMIGFSCLPSLRLWSRRFMHLAFSSNEPEYQMEWSSKNCWGASSLPPYCVIISINYLLILVRHFILLCPEVREPKMGCHVRRNLR